MHKHTDGTCKHDLKVCTDCGNVYCSKCNREWFKEQYAYQYATYPYIPYVGTANPPTITWTDITSGDPVQPTHTHQA
jgi:hypothetical protein